MLNAVFFAALAAYLAATLLQFAAAAFKKKTMEQGAWVLCLLAFGLNSAYLIARGVIAGRLPLSNQFAFSTAFAWGIALLYIVLRLRMKAEWMGVIALPCMFLVLSYAALQPKEISELMPALRSAWFGLHIGSAVFSYAVKMGMIQYNPCRAVTLPPLETGREKTCYTLEEAQAFLDALADAPLCWQVFFSLALFGGFRREELCGFEFSDFDFERCTVSVRRASLYTASEGIFTAPTKTTKSRRTLKLPAWIFDLVKRLRVEQARQRLALGDQWHECGRLFTKQDGSPVNPERAYKWLRGFCEEKGLPFYGVHQFRHLNASLLIYNGEDVRAVSAALGHSQTTTTLNIYAHTFETAQARACDALADALPVKFGKKRA